MKKVLISLSALALLGSSSAALAATAPAVNATNPAANAAAAKEAAKLAKKAAAAKAKAAKLARAAAAARAKADANPGNMKLAALAAKAEQQAAAAEAEASAYEAAAAAASSGDLAAAAAVSVAPAAAAAVSTGAASSAIAAASVELIDDEDDDEIEEVDSSAKDAGPSKAERRAAIAQLRERAKALRELALSKRAQAILDAATKEAQADPTGKTIENAKGEELTDTHSPEEKAKLEAEAKIAAQVAAIKALLNAAKSAKTAAQTKLSEANAKAEQDNKAYKDAQSKTSAALALKNASAALDTNAAAAKSKIDELKTEPAKDSNNEPDPKQVATLTSALLEKIGLAESDINTYLTNLTEEQKAVTPANELKAALKAVTDISGKAKVTKDDGSEEAATGLYKELDALTAANATVEGRDEAYKELVDAITTAIGQSAGSNQPADGSTNKLVEKLKTESDKLSTTDPINKTTHIDPVKTALDTLIEDLKDQGRVHKAIKALRQNGHADETTLTALESALTAAKEAANSVKLQDLEDKENAYVAAKGINDKAKLVKAELDKIGIPADQSEPAKLLSAAKSAISPIISNSSQPPKSFPTEENLKKASSSEPTKGALDNLKVTSAKLLEELGKLQKDTNLATAPNDLNTKVNEAHSAATTFDTAVGTGIEKVEALKTAITTAKGNPPSEKTTYEDGDAVANAIQAVSDAMVKNGAGQDGKPQTGIEPSATEVKTKVEAATTLAGTNESTAKTNLSTAATTVKEAISKPNNNDLANKVKDLGDKAAAMSTASTKDKAKEKAKTAVNTLKTEVEKLSKGDESNENPKLLTTLKEKAAAVKKADEKAHTDATSAQSQAKTKAQASAQAKEEAQAEFNTAQGNETAYQGFYDEAKTNFDAKEQEAQELEKEAASKDEELDNE